ncbi:MAG: CBS domain-containing protein [Kofleriaceae bacterium]|nr:CBS domain-containing protein [Kofleriaceae bacterium]
MATTQRVYDGQGRLRVRDVHPCGHDELARPPRRVTIAHDVPVTAIMSRRLVCADPDLGVSALPALFLGEHIGCLPIIDERGRPQGIVTKSDLVEHLDADATAWTLKTARDVMMPLALTLDERATVAHAASLMTLEDLHHVLIVSCEGSLIGVISAKDIVRWLVDNDELPGKRE